MYDNEGLRGYEKAQRGDILEIGGEKFYSSYEAARQLGICQGTWHSLRRRYKLQGQLIGKKKFYPESELMRLLSGRRTVPGK